MPIGIVAAAFLQPLACLAGRLDWRIDLLSHFPEPALVLTLGAAAVLARRRSRMAFAMVLLAALQASALLRDHGVNVAVPKPASHDRLRILMANVLSSNERYSALADLIRRERPDVVGLVEVTTAWIDGLADVRRDFPYRLEAPAKSKGLALWFRARARAIDPPAYPLPNGWPFLHASFDFAGRTRDLWLIHPTAPFRRKNLPELDALGRLIGAARGSRIVVGDMNCTENSPHFADFLSASGLRDSRIGFGRQPSWPTWLFYRIPIDHAFVDDDLAVVDRRLGSAIGSDHFPLVLELAPASVEPAASLATSASRLDSAWDR